MDKRIQTLLIFALGAGVGAGGTFVAVDDDLQLDDNDSIKIYKGDTLATHAISIRRQRPAGPVALAVYSSVQTGDGGVEDLGEVRCGLDAGEQAKLRAILNSNAAERCAQGDSGIPLAQLFVHALDLRRRAQPFEVHGTDAGPDGGPIDVVIDSGTDLIFSMESYATRVLSDGGFVDLGRGNVCAMPDAGQAQFDLIGLACVKRAKGLGK